MDILTTNTELLTINGAGSLAGAVRYDKEQNLTEDEKVQAQNNIGLNSKFATVTQVGSINNALYDVNMRLNQTNANVTRSAEQIETNRLAIKGLQSSVNQGGTKVFHSSRGGGAQYGRMSFVDQYDDNGYGKEISLSRTDDYGDTYQINVGYTVSDTGRINAENACDKVISGNYNGVSTNYTKLWYMPVNGDVSEKGFFEGSITFTVNAGSSVSFMAIKTNGSYDTASWAPGQDVMSFSTFALNHPITVPFCWKANGIYGIGIKGANSNTTISINNYYVKYKQV